MATLNRRELVLGVGTLAGLTTLGSARALDLTNPETIDPRDVLRTIHITGRGEQVFLARIGSGTAPVATLPADAPGRMRQRVEGVPVTPHDPSGRVFSQGLAFVCDPRRQNHLYVSGEPLIARRYCYSVSNIAWTPGRGLPYYDSFAPRYDYAVKAYYRAAKWHQIVPLIGDEEYFIGCQASDVCQTDTPGPVSFDVNDSDYNDNAGAYVVTIWSWS